MQKWGFCVWELGPVGGVRLYPANRERFLFLKSNKNYTIFNVLAPIWENVSTLLQAYIKN